MIDIDELNLLAVSEAAAEIWDRPRTAVVLLVGDPL